MEQLQQSIKKWNEEEDLSRWESYYHEDSYHGHRLRSREEKLLQFLDSLPLKKKAKVLELGYGAGMTSAKIVSRGFDLTGIDISNKLRDIAINNCKKAKGSGTFKFLIGNAERLDFPDNSFDCVVGLGFIHYLENPLQCLKEVKRVLKPNGCFIITQRNMLGISSMDGPLKWMRAAYYGVGRRRYELRWQDTPIAYPILGLATIVSPLSKRMKKLQFMVRQHKKIGLVRKNALSYTRMKRLIELSGLTIVNSSGAGYLTKKNKLFPKAAERLNQYLQHLNDSGTQWIKKFGNSVVFLAQKK
jgi:ubiquinone/menaquinone biosynthesis C-methylase UbiE